MIFNRCRIVKGPGEHRPTMDVGRVIAAAFGEPQKCYGHCGDLAALRYLKSGDPLVACYACPAGYVSKVMAYGTSPTRERLRTFLTEALGDAIELRDEDLRVATRHLWDFRVSESDISATYWTQNYRRKSDDPNRIALFTCRRCGSLHLHPVSESRPLCPRCAG